MVPILAQVRLHDTVQSTARRLMDLKLDSLPVVDDEGKPVGFVTEQDLMNSLLSSAVPNNGSPIAGRWPRRFLMNPPRPKKLQVSFLVRECSAWLLFASRCPLES